MMMIFFVTDGENKEERERERERERRRRRIERHKRDHDVVVGDARASARAWNPGAPSSYDTCPFLHVQETADRMVRLQSLVVSVSHFLVP